MTRRLVFAPEAEQQLVSLYRYISAAASPGIAGRYINSILKTCENLQDFPFRGVARDDIRPGLRVTHHNKRTTVAFAVEEEVVSIVGVFYGGRDYEPVLTRRTGRPKSG